MTPLFWKTVSENMGQVLLHFMQTEIGARFYLGGGTALSLQIGHRRSLDLDFFSPSEDIPSLRSVLENALTPFQPTLADAAWGNLVYLSNEVRLGFYGYGFPMVAALTETESVRLAAIEDIALMKLDTLLSRAARKDFYDLYFICQQIPLRALLDLAPRKYAGIRDFEAQVVKRLVYFENAEADADPVLLRPVAWPAVKNFFIQQAKEIGSSWL
ncbi:MAG: nucleotidyl transferase AbiEii/AbiGii toxin family protein [Anaerolineales bacterium]|jgi:hypothetical protein|nr:nucleotidyl transferase AbiEii/AbiGii toxin family protein [Anaerolineales bacterium]